MRQRIDISEIEAQTKIRAKYLRALENEEWDLIPGTTFVKSFLRTYAEALGVDSRSLLEEYKLRYELPESELLPITPQTTRERARAARRSRRPSARRDVIVAACVVGLVALLIVLGRGGGNDSSPPSRGTDTNAGATTTNDNRTATTTESKPAAPKRVRLGLHPTGSVYVCLRAGGRLVIDKQTLNASTPIRIYRSPSFRILLGNNNLKLTIDGKKWQPAPSSKPIAFAITAKGHRPIKADSDVLCA